MPDEYWPYALRDVLLHLRDHRRSWFHYHRRNGREKTKDGELGRPVVFYFDVVDVAAEAASATAA